MFQYAAGRALSLKHSVPLQLDVSGFMNYELHQGFELRRIFNCTGDIASEADVREILGWQFTSGVRRVVSRPSMAALRRNAFVIEPHFQYWSGIKNAPSNCYITGYWQSEKYFSDITEKIRKDFSFKLPLEYKNFELANKISQTNAVSLHVRRGDYISDIKNSATYEMCSLDYYKRSICNIAEKVDSPYFYIFSDDVAWARDNLKIEFMHQYIDHNRGTESYNDMRLMSLCKHHIIANSSFSWWGAWLNPSLEKIVIAPKHWFANQTNVQDLLPLGWIKL